MKIAELFVQLGQKGGDKVASTLGDLSKGMKTLAIDASVVTAGISAAIYAFKEFAVQSNAAGMGINQFNMRTGQSEQALQRWQYLMRQSGVSAEETAGNLESVQKAMFQLAIGKPPEGFQAFTNVLGPGGFDRAREKDTEYVLSKLREYAQKTKNDPAARNHVLDSFGLSGNFIGALSNSQVDLNKIQQSQLYSDKEVNSLAKMSVGWSNLGENINKAIGRLNIKFGPSLLKDLSAFTTQMITLVNTLASLAEKLKIIQGLSEVVHGLTAAAGFFNNGYTSKNIGEFVKKQEARKAAAPLDVNKSILDAASSAYSGAKGLANQVLNMTNNIAVHTTGDGAEIGAMIGMQINKTVNQAFRQLPQGKPR